MFEQNKGRNLINANAGHVFQSEVAWEDFLKLRGLDQENSSAADVRYVFIVPTHPNFQNLRSLRWNADVISSLRIVFGDCD